MPFSLLQPKPAFAYTNGMSASVVLGQPSFTGSTAQAGGSVSGAGLNSPRSVLVTSSGKLIVGDFNNFRVLIWNSIPTTNGATADVVIGQTALTNNGNNQGGSVAANTLSQVLASDMASDKLILSDYLNNRVLIYNSIPTSNNTPADIVLGEPNMTSNGGGTSSSLFSQPGGADYDPDTGKLAIAELGNNRVVIYNSLPTSNGAAADVVVGQSNFTTGTSGTTGSKLQLPYSVRIFQGKLLVADYLNNRVMIWNSIPTSNGVSADVVIGQQNFTSGSANQGGSCAANTLNLPSGMTFDGTRLFIDDSGNNRILVFNGIPTSNNASAYQVIGQSDFTSCSNNQGGSTGVNTLDPLGTPFVLNSKLYIPDAGNNRMLIYTDVTTNPGLTLNNSPEGRDNGLLRLKGTVTIPSTSSYTISNVQYSVNGGGFSGANATDGSFNSTTEEFYFDFDPKSNQQKDSSGNLIDGYTVRVKSTNSNLDVTDNLFYFSPFNQNEPLDNAVTNSTTPTFDFGVIKQKSILNDNLSKYQIQIRKGGSTSTAPWETIIDDIPIDKANGTYETNKFYATYSDDSSRIKVYSKVKTLAGSIQWKVVATDKTGHTQDSSSRSLRINTKNSVTTSSFPLAILNISGLGNPNISTTNLSAIKDTYYLGSLTPIFYGIASTNAKVILTLTEQDCFASLAMTVDSCTKTYSTVANQDSRYGINIPRGDLKWGKKYTINMSVAYNQDYNELPTFTLSTSGASSKPTTPSTTSQPTSEEKEKVTTPSVTSPTPQPTPTPQSSPKQASVTKKNCFLFVCF